MKYRLLSIITLLLLLSLHVRGQESYADRVKRYIQQYYPLAIAEQKRAGVPACITLAQGVFETEAGSSELCTIANNHFGIKCKADFKGEYFIHTDDRPNEHFMKYSSAEASYKDHSDHLKRNPRYAVLFTLPVTDYAGWAYGLKNCGYATNPAYGEKLIQLIEDFNLQQYNTATEGSTSSTEQTPKAVLKPVEEALAPAKDTVQSTTTTVAQPNPQAEPATPPAQPTATTVAKPQPKADTAQTSISFAQPATKPEPPVVKKVATPPPAPVIDTPEAVVEEPTTATTTPAVKNRNETKHHIVIIEENEPNAHPSGSTTRHAKDSATIEMINGLRALRLRKGEMLLQYAIKYNIQYSKLLAMNDLEDAPLPFDMPVYLDKKMTQGVRPKHIVTADETMLQIAQQEGMQLKHLQALNRLEPGEEPAAGSVLYLQYYYGNKPALAQHLPKQLNTERGDTVITLSPPAPNKTGKQAPDATIMPEKPSEPAPVANTPPQETPAKPQQPIAQETNNTHSAPPPAKEELPVQPKANSEPDSMPAPTSPEPDNSAKNVPAASPANKDNKAPVAPINTLPKLPMPNEKGATDATKAQPKATMPPPPVAAKPKPASLYYTLKKGDTFYKIAERYHTTPKQLMEWNNMAENDLVPGDKIIVKP